MTDPHLSEDRLLDVALDRDAHHAGRGHLDSCPHCEARLERLTQLLADTTGVARAEADAVFTPERLGRQQARILQRIDQGGRHGQVVTFPTGQVRPARSLRTSTGMRWVAAAAVAGICVGMLADRYALVPAGRETTASRSLGPPTDQIRSVVSAAVSEEEFLGRLEMAAEGSSGTALQPLHELTPLVWEVPAP